MIELRKYSLEYVAQFAQIRNNINVLKYAFDSVPYPFTEADAHDWITQQITNEPQQRLMIFYNDELAGEIGITLKKDIFKLNAEIGYFVAKQFWGKGIASEAISLMTNYAFDNFEVQRIIAGVMKPNKGSMRALEKNGYQLEGIRKQEVIKRGEILDNYYWVKFRNNKVTDYLKHKQNK